MSGGFEAFDAFDDAPSRAGLAVTLVPAMVAVGATATVPTALLVSSVAAVVVLGGVRVGSRRVVTVGTIAVFGAVLLTGVQGAAIVQVCLGAAATVVAWDAGTNAIDLASQVGARAETGDVLVVHTLATAGVAVVVGACGVAVYWLGHGGEPTTAVVLLLVAALVFVLLLDR